MLFSVAQQLIMMSILVGFSIIDIPLFITKKIIFTNFVRIYLYKSLSPTTYLSIICNSYQPMQGSKNTNTERGYRVLKIKNSNINNENEEEREIRTAVDSHCHCIYILHTEAGWIAWSRNIDTQARSVRK